MYLLFIENSDFATIERKTSIICPWTIIYFISETHFFLRKQSNGDPLYSVKFCFFSRFNFSRGHGWLDVRRICIISPAIARICRIANWLGHTHLNWRSNRETRKWTGGLSILRKLLIFTLNERFNWCHKLEDQNNYAQYKRRKLALIAVRHLVYQEGIFYVILYFVRLFLSALLFFFFDILIVINLVKSTLPGAFFIFIFVILSS